MSNNPESNTESPFRSVLQNIYEAHLEPEAKNLLNMTELKRHSFLPKEKETLCGMSVGGLSKERPRYKYLLDECIYCCRRSHDIGLGLEHFLFDEIELYCEGINDSQAFGKVEFFFPSVDGRYFWFFEDTINFTFHSRQTPRGDFLYPSWHMMETTEQIRMLIYPRLKDEDIPIFREWLARYEQHATPGELGIDFIPEEE